MQPYILNLEAVDSNYLPFVGGKAANLGELARINGIRVPPGFCITTHAFKKVFAALPSLDDRLHHLSQLKPGDRKSISEMSAAIRHIIEEAAISPDIIDAITQQLSHYPAGTAWAIRSSATAEDLPTASFAGQQESYLNIKEPASVLEHIRKCWASLFTDRAVTYRIQNGFDHRQVQLAVIVQQMIFPDVSGILFTADPVNGNRRILSIDASFGLGEALVSGRVNPDTYKVRDGHIIRKQTGRKELRIDPGTNGGTIEHAVSPGQQQQPALSDEQILELARLGRAIEAHFGQPQDIEWCLASEQFFFVQSRPITTLFPIPEVNDGKNHVYVSVGHQQMMTDPMKPLGISVRQLTGGRHMYEAGGRMFVDVGPDLASPAKRHMLMNVLGNNDPLIKSGLQTILDRGDFIELQPEEEQTNSAKPGPPAGPDYAVLNDYDPSIVTELIQLSRQSIAQLENDIGSKSGIDLINFIQQDLEQLRKNISDPQSFGVFMTAMNASTWINRHMEEWLGEKGVADTLTQSVPNNITSEMGLALLDVADAIRPYPAVIAFLQQVKSDAFIESLLTIEGGQMAHDAIIEYLDKYGMRCVGEIDITRPRWSEQPSILIPLILNNIQHFAPGESRRRFERGLQQALDKEQELLARLQQLPGGEQKARETKRMTGLLRNLVGYREYPKYEIVSRYFIYKQALLKEAERLVEAGVLTGKEDIYYLRFDELREVVRSHKIDHILIEKRRNDFLHYARLNPPRIITSEGEIITGSYDRAGIPDHALVGLPVSAGIVEGRARVIFSIEDADLQEGDILITPFTDPSWTPLFISISGLVTEVGGLMTHGAVIAREYGLPAVVGVDNATKLIKDGQRLRIDGTAGIVQVLANERL